MNLYRLRTAATAIALLLGVYLPAFAITSLIRPALPVAIALVIGITLCLALGAIFWLAHRSGSFTSFGFALPRVRFLLLAIGLGLPLALGSAWLVFAFPSPAPFDAALLPRWQQVVYFVVAAPVQEELIFRGLVQSYLQDRWHGAPAIRSARLSLPVLCTAILFAVVHLGAGPATVVGAFTLSILAGELRARSGSLLPAVIVHALFNAAAMLVPSA